MATVALGIDADPGPPHGNAALGPDCRPQHGILTRTGGCSQHANSHRGRRSARSLRRWFNSNTNGNAPGLPNLIVTTSSLLQSIAIVIAAHRRRGTRHKVNSHSLIKFASSLQNRLGFSFHHYCRTPTTVAPVGPEDQRR